MNFWDKPWLYSGYSSAVIFKSALRSSGCKFTFLCWTCGQNYRFQVLAVPFRKTMWTDERKEKFLTSWKERVDADMGISRAQNESSYGKGKSLHQAAGHLQLMHCGIKLSSGKGSRRRKQWCPDRSYLGASGSQQKGVPGSVLKTRKQRGINLQPVLAGIAKSRREIPGSSRRVEPGRTGGERTW